MARDMEEDKGKMGEELQYVGLILFKSSKADNGPSNVDQKRKRKERENLDEDTQVYDKSMISFSKNVDEDTQEVVGNIMGV